MEFIKPNTNIDFIRYARGAAIFSGVLILIGLLSLWHHGGPNYGVDFVGGTMMQVKFRQQTDVASIRKALVATALDNVTVQDFGRGGEEFLIRLPVTQDGAPDLSGRIRQSLETQFGEEAFEVRRIETVGPKVGKELRRRGILAVVFATIMMGTYLAFRFEPRFGVGAAVALLHDVMIAVGAFSLLNLEFDLTVVAALLTVVGFSVNDTVIVCDRIRENMHKMRRESLATIINRSINETLSRTIITTGTAVLVILSLLFLGGKVIFAFAFTLLVGITIGTYSSIYVASPVVLLWAREGKRR
jgi:preprotein translocase subunit SecF